MKRNQDAIAETFANQNIIITVCFTISSGGIAFLSQFLYDKTLSWSLLPCGITYLLWVISIMSGFIFLIKRGNNSASAQYGEENDLHQDYFKAPGYIKAQVYLFFIGLFFLGVWTLWSLLANTFTCIPK